MSPPQSRPPRAGGVLLAFAILVGAASGIILGEASAGVLIGTAAGAAALAWLWWRDRGV